MAKTGTLTIQGSIDLKQFWPKGGSDADTTKIVVRVVPGSFQFKSSAAAPALPTPALGNALSIASGQAPTYVIKYRKSTHPHINVRLQGIDAPELHYRFYGPLPKKNPKTKIDLSGAELARFKASNNQHEFRQFYSEIATSKLRDFLAGHANAPGSVDCVFVTKNISVPADVVDVYGRFVGDIWIANQTINLNEWLLKEGWVFPAYYVTMSDAEIALMNQAYSKGKKKHATTLDHYSKTIIAFNNKLFYRKGGPENNPKDVGKMIFPKLFRRQCKHAIYQNANINVGTFIAYLGLDQRDKYVRSEDLSQYRKTANKAVFERPFTELLKNNQLIRDPNRMVFAEKSSRLVDATTQQPIKSF